MPSIHYIASFFPETFLILGFEHLVTLSVPNLHYTEDLNILRGRNEPTATGPQKDIIILLPYPGLHSNQITKRRKSCANRFYSFVDVKAIFQNTWRIKSFFPYKDRLNWSQLSRVIY